MRTTETIFTVIREHGTVTGKPGAVKMASPVWRRAGGKGRKYLASGLSYPIYVTKEFLPQALPLISPSGSIMGRRAC